MNLQQENDWTNPISSYLQNGILPPNDKEAKKLIKTSTRFTILDGQLYKRGFSSPLLKCLGRTQADYVMAEVHEGISGHHLGGRALAMKILRAGYYWPTMRSDASEFVKRCDKCQKFANFHSRPAEELGTTIIPWPFHRWGMDLLGPFPLAPGQLRYLIVAIDYFTKWIEAEPLATITSERVRKFVWKNIICRFGIPQSFVTDNGTQFSDKKFKEFCSDLHITIHFTSVEHPQTNGQAEAANKVILNGLKKRLDQAKGNWTDQLHNVLWAYRTTPHSSTQETPFKLTYGVEAMIPVEVGEPSLRHSSFNPEENDTAILTDLDLLDEVRELAHIRDAAFKAKTAKRYNAAINPRNFKIGDLVLRRADIGGKNTAEGKLAPNWEGPYRVTKIIGKGAYKLTKLNGDPIPRTWNAVNLRKYYS